MIFKAAKIQGAYLIQAEPKGDERGFLARIWDKQPFLEQGINAEWVQAYISKSQMQGTLRGLHYQVAPQAEAKLVRCLRGKIFEVLADARSESPSFGQWQAFEVDAERLELLYVPAGVAHGFLTLTDNVEILNLSGAPYTPECERGFRYNDPKFNINWPAEIKIISDKDLAWPDFKS